MKHYPSVLSFTGVGYRNNDVVFAEDVQINEISSDLYSKHLLRNQRYKILDTTSCRPSPNPPSAPYPVPTRFEPSPSMLPALSTSPAFELLGANQTIAVTSPFNILHAAPLCTTNPIHNKASSSEHRSSEMEHHKNDQLNKQKEGKGHWKEELSSNSEAAVSTIQATALCLGSFQMLIVLGTIRSRQTGTKYRTQGTILQICRNRRRNKWNRSIRNRNEYG